MESIFVTYFLEFFLFTRKANNKSYLDSEKSRISVIGLESCNFMKIPTSSFSIYIPFFIFQYWPWNTTSASYIFSTPAPHLTYFTYTCNFVVYPRIIRVNIVPHDLKMITPVRIFKFIKKLSRSKDFVRNTFSTVKLFLRIVMLKTLRSRSVCTRCRY